MTEEERNFADDRSPGLRARRPCGEGSPHGDVSRAAALDPLDLAAYLEGRLEGKARALVEARLADSPDSLDLLVASREALEAGSMAAPESLILRAAALEGAPNAGGGWRAWLAGFRSAPPAPRRALAYRAIASRAQFSRAAAFASLAAVFLLAGAAGFELGRAEAAYSAQIDGFLAREIGFAIERSAEDML